MARSPRRSRSPEGLSSRRRERDHSPSRYDRPHASSSRRPDERRSGRYDDGDDRRDRDRDREREREPVRDRERERRDRDKEVDRHRERDRRDSRDGYRERDDRERYDRRRDDRDRDRRDDRGDRDRDRRRDEPRRLSREPPSTLPPLPSALPRRRSPSPTRSKHATASPSPAPDGDKPKTAKERLEAWKRQRELEKLKEGKVTSGNSTPEPPTDKKPISSFTTTGKAALPSKPTGFSLGGLSRIGLPVKPGPGSNLKRTLTQLDDEEESDRKLQKLDLPDVNPEVQTGEAVDETVGDDLAVVDAEEHEDEVKPKIEDAMEVDQKEEAPEEEEDELEAFMKQNSDEVKKVNLTDAKRMGLLDLDDEAEDLEVKDKAEEELSKAEALLAMAASKSRKKDLPTPDHSKIQYEPFRKAFYSAPVEALEMTEEEAELMRLEMDGIKIRGADAPKPVKNWGAFGIPTVCLDMIRRREWTTPTAIQAQAIPAIMSGRDVIGIAKTGSGKTIAFLVPMFRHVKDQRPVGGAEGPIGIILSPTRELAMQIYREAKPFMAALNLKISCCVGGQSISEDIATLKKGAEVVVCTPGRMIDLLTANNGRVTNCRRCTYLVLDEADRMFDMGFEPQVMKIINNSRPDAQKVLFSATFPKTMEGLARKILVRPLEITVGGRSVVAEEIDQRVEVRDQDTKFNRLLEILGESNMNLAENEETRTLIFVDRQESADDLFGALNKAGYLSASLHGGREQVDREQAIKDFKSGAMPIIVATSVAARGLDVKELRLVVNYDCPNHMEDYVHRAGRTGRAGNKGTCITFVTPDQERFSVDIVRALEASKAFIPPELKAMSDAFLGKIKSGKARAAASGFAGKGLERIERKREEKDRSEKHTYGDTSEALSLSSREGAVIPYKPKTAETQFKPPENAGKGDSDYTFTEINVEIIHGPAPDKATNPSLYSASGNAGYNGKTAGSSNVSLPKSTMDALDKARAEGRSVDAERLAKVVAKLTQSIELTKAEKFGLATLESGLARKTKDPDATEWHAIFPINDYPQKARWKVTNKEQMSLLVEHSNASITMRGIYYSPGEEPKIGGEPKLHLLIESNDKDKVSAAVDEIRRTLVEASMAALNNADRSLGGGGGAGRYAI